MLVGAKNSELSVHFLILVFLGNWCKLISSGWLVAWQNFTGNLVGGSSGFELLSGGVVNLSLLWLVSDLGPENELGLVRVKSLHIELKALLVGVGSSVINTDSDGSGEAGAQLGSFELR